ncbi:SprT-like family-domain-containing protein [Hypoxylon sp. FL1284]|nr:SprT-like family-domain-containing protein [Hypoxylon sp. FL1284]
MLDEYGGSSEDEFPDVDVIIQQYQHNVHDPASREGAKDAQAPVAARSQTGSSIKKEPVKPNPGVKATPLRRRKLVQSQTVDGSLLQPWNGRAAREEGDIQPSNSKSSSTRTRSRNTKTKTKTKTKTNTSSRSLSKSAPAEAKAAGNRSGSLDTDSNIPAVEMKHPKQDGETQKGQSKKGQLSEEIKELVALLGEFDDESSDILGDTQESSEDVSEFISVSDTESDGWNSQSEVTSNLPTRRSGSPDDQWARPKRTLFASPGKKSASSNEQPRGAIADPSKRAPKPQKQSNARVQSSKSSQPEHLEDAFQKLQIFNEDSEPDDPSARGDRRLHPTLDPMTPKKTLPASPSKAPRIPQSPWKPEHREFWDPEKNFSWIDKHSPEKKLESPRKRQLQDDARAGTTITNAEKRSTKKAFEAIKEEMALAFLQELDDRITDGQLAQLTKETGGLKITWSKTLNSTAGRAHWKCKTLSTRRADGSTDKHKQHWASIELASKVLANEADLLNTVAHEFCHLAVFVLSGKPKMAHGAEFKAWGARCGRLFADRGIVVTTKHNYEIDYKYVWRCASCPWEVKRHSKSVNTDLHRCASCKGRLMQIKPTPRGRGGPSPTPGGLETERENGGKTAATTTASAKKQPSQWQVFMAREMKALAQTNKSMSSKERLAAVAAKWHDLPRHEKQGGQRGQSELKELQSAVEILTIEDEE